MLVQPLVENAVLHGLSSKREGGTVTIKGRLEEGAMVLEVSDDGVGPGRSTRRANRTGLANLRERLALTFGGKANLAVRERSGGGFECALRVPR
jgi:sensor histidine kinase YesM